MRLLTAELRARIPPRYSQEHVKLAEKTVPAKFFFPAGDSTWFVTEEDDDDGDFRMFGYVVGFEDEWDYFSLNEWEGLSVHGLTVELDEYSSRARSKT